MAGGMSRRDGPTMAERVGAGRSDRSAYGRHVWVVDAPGHPGRWAGLLMEWRRIDAGWQGRVVYVIPEPDGCGNRAIERWLAAECLLPA
jgi:hypothetical protein